jgi:LmbE family N-acetylglucosaminyl deacetylase
MMIGSALFRRECVEAVGGFIPNMGYQGHWDFYLRVAGSGYIYACCKKPVVMLRIHPNNVGTKHGEMLAGRIDVLNRLFTDPSMEWVPEGVHQKAFYQAYTDFAEIYYIDRDSDKGAECLNKALSYAPLQFRDVERISSAVVDWSLDPEIEDPLKHARDLFASIRPSPEIRRMRSKLLGQLNAHLAFRHYQVGELDQVWRHALGTVIHDPSWLRNRGLARIALEGLAGPRIFDWIRSRQYLVSSDFLEAVSKTTSIFVSPHFDDAVLSCGGTLGHLAQRGADILLVTVFTADPAGGTELSPLAQQLHEVWGEDTYPHRIRGLEEREVAKYLGAKYLWLGFLDGMYRYPEMKSWAGQFRTDFDPRMDPCFESVRDALLQVIGEHPGATVFAPLGLGHHRDHLIVHQALEDIERMTSAASRYYYYEDYPYAATVNPRVRLKQLAWPAKALTIDIRDTLKERVSMINMYASQLTILFDDIERIHEDVESYATRIGTKGKPRERFWSPLASN